MTLLPRSVGPLALLAVLALSAHAQAPKYTFKLATLAPEGSAWMQKFEKIKKEVLEATGGQVLFKAYPGGVLGDEAAVLFKMKVGQVDGGGFMGYGAGRICPESGALGTPLLFDSFEELDYVFGKIRPYLEQKCRENGYVALGWTEIGFNYLYSTKPVRSIGELRDAKPWSVPEDPYLQELFAAARVPTVTVPVTDVLTALQTGLLQTIYAPPLACVAMQWFARVKYRNSIRLLYSNGGVFVTQKAWARLPPDLQQKVLEIFHRGMRELSADVRRSNEEALEVMAKNGIQVIESTPAQVAEFKALSAQVVAKLRGKTFAAEAADLVERYLSEFRAARAAGHAP